MIRPASCSRKPVCRGNRGVTLLLTMLVLVLAVTVLSRLMLQTTVDRLNGGAGPFIVESRWMAEGVALQWLQRSQDPSQDTHELLGTVTWKFPASVASPSVEIYVHPSSAQDKLYLPAVEPEAWTRFWREQVGALELAEHADRALFDTGNACLEVILAPKYITAQAAYQAAGQGKIAPADLLTVWGDGRVDLNRCPVDVLRVRLRTFTESQISGIVRLRTSGVISQTASLIQELSLSEEQAQVLREAAALKPACIELVIRVRKGGFLAMFHAVVTLGKNGQVLEVRPIL